MEPTYSNLTYLSFLFLVSFNIYVDNLLLFILTALLLDFIKVMAGFLNLSIQKSWHSLSDVSVLNWISLQNWAGSPMSIGKEEVHVLKCKVSKVKLMSMDEMLSHLTCADHGKGVIISVHHYIVHGSNHICMISDCKTNIGKI